MEKPEVNAGSYRDIILLLCLINLHLLCDWCLQMCLFHWYFQLFGSFLFLWGHLGCQGAKIKRDLTGNALQFHPRPGKWNLNWWLHSQDCNTLTSQTPLMQWRRRIIYLSMDYSLTAEDPAAEPTSRTSNIASKMGGVIKLNEMMMAVVKLTLTFHKCNRN